MSDYVVDALDTTHLLSGSSCARLEHDRTVGGMKNDIPYLPEDTIQSRRGALRRVQFERRGNPFAWDRYTGQSLSTTSVRPPLQGDSDLFEGAHFTIRKHGQPRMVDQESDIRFLTGG